MEYHNNILCVSGAELIISEANPNGLISLALWQKWTKEGVSVVRRGCYGKPSLIDLNNLSILVSAGPYIGAGIIMT